MGSFDDVLIEINTHKDDEWTVSHRSKDIHQLEKDMQDIHETFTALRNLVHIQQEPLEYIEDCIENAETETEWALIELENAQKHKTSYHKKIGVLVIGGIAISVVSWPLLGAKVALWFGGLAMGGGIWMTH